MVVPACIAMAFAVGFIKANLGPFGADQVTQKHSNYLIRL